MRLVLGLDPGFASLGFALVRLLPEGESVLALGVVRTSKSDKKRKVLSADDNVRRCREIASAVRRLMDGQQLDAVSPPMPDLTVAAVAAEAMSFPRNASAAAKMAMTWGVVVGEVERRRLPLLQASPQEVKLAACGRKDASKEDVAAAMMRRFSATAGSPARLRAHLANVPATMHEHAWDALAVVAACLDSEQMRLVRALGA